MSKKYVLTGNTIIKNNTRLYQIKAVKAFGDVKVGDLGGHIRSEENLSHKGSSWVYEGAFIYDNTILKEDTRVYPWGIIYVYIEPPSYRIFSYESLPLLIVFILLFLIFNYLFKI